MTRGQITVFPLLVSLFALSCDKNPLALVDSTVLVPFLDMATISPASENIDLLQPNPDGSYSISTTLSVRAQGASAVTAHLFRPATGTQLGEAVLLDNGVTPDSIANDGVYGAAFPFSLIRAQAGIYRIEIVATNEQQTSSNKISLAFNATRNNSTPTLDATSLVAPDTIDRPVSGTSLFFISIAAADSDGIADVKQVYFINLASASPSRQFLLDDGGVIQQGGVTSGDLLAGDGVFSIIFQATPAVPPGVYPFSFKASDSFGAVSDSVLHYLTVR